MWSKHIATATVVYDEEKKDAASPEIIAAQLSRINKSTNLYYAKRQRWRIRIKTHQEKS